MLLLVTVQTRFRVFWCRSVSVVFKKISFQNSIVISNDFLLECKEADTISSYSELRSFEMFVPLNDNATKVQSDVG